MLRYVNLPEVGNMLGRTFLVRDYNNAVDHDEFVRILNLMAAEGHEWPAPIFTDADNAVLVLEELPQQTLWGVVAVWLDGETDTVALLWVHPMLRLRKFGSTLLELIESQCGSTVITAECPEGNVGGRAFLFKRGYRQVSQGQYLRERRAA